MVARGTAGQTRDWTSSSATPPPTTAWASWIAWELEAAGYRTMIQAWDFVPGTNFIDFMDRGVSEAPLVVAVLSRNYLTLPLRPHGVAGRAARRPRRPVEQAGHRPAGGRPRSTGCCPRSPRSTCSASPIRAARQGAAARPGQGGADGRAKPEAAPDFPTGSDLPAARRRRCRRPAAAAASRARPQPGVARRSSRPPAAADAAAASRSPCCTWPAPGSGGRLPDPGEPFTPEDIRRGSGPTSPQCTTGARPAPTSWWSPAT